MTAEELEALATRCDHGNCHSVHLSGLEVARLIRLAREGLKVPALREAITAHQAAYRADSCDYAEPYDETLWAVLDDA